MNKIPWTYIELLHEIYNFPTELEKVTRQMGYNKYHFYWCKERYYMVLWSTLNDFINNPEKWTAEYRLNQVKEDPQIKLL